MGLNVLALTAIRVFIPPSPGIKIGSLFEPGGVTVNSVVFETPSGETIPAVVLLSNTKVTVCGSAAPSVGLSHTTVSPALILVSYGTNTVHGDVVLPPPAATVTVCFSEVVALEDPPYITPNDPIINTITRIIDNIF